MTTAAEVKELKAELRHLASKVEKTVANGNATAHNGLADVLSISPDEVRRVAKKAGKTMRVYLGNKADEAAELYHEAETKITQNPVKSVAIALAAGFILSSLFRSK